MTARTILGVLVLVGVMISMLHVIAVGPHVSCFNERGNSVQCRVANGIRCVQVTRGAFLFSEYEELNFCNE